MVMLQASIPPRLRGIPESGGNAEEHDRAHRERRGQAAVGRRTTPCGVGFMTWEPARIPLLDVHVLVSGRVCLRTLSAVIGGS
jgi:hypothetical protein